MRYSALTLVGAVAAIACAVFPFGSARAEVMRTLRIDSTPPGAEVFLLQGSKETRIGTTPFDYQAEFHSDVSVLRLAARKPGYETKRIEVSARESRILIKLGGRAFAAAPKDIKDPGLRRLQEQINPAIDRIAPQALKSQAPFRIDLAGAVRVQRVGNEVYLVVPVVLLSGPQGFRQVSSGNAESFLTGVWDQLGQAFVIPLAQAAKDVNGLDGILLDAEYGQMQRGFNVGVKTETRTRVELECQGGTRQERRWDSCARQSEPSYYYSGGQRYLEPPHCEGGYVTTSVYDPCLTRVPVTHTQTEVVANPQVAFKNTRSKARYVATVSSLPAHGSAKELYAKIGATLMDNNGTVIARHGHVPTD